MRARKSARFVNFIFILDVCVVFSTGVWVVKKMPALLEARVQRISEPPPKMGRVARSSIAFRLSSALMRSLFLGAIWGPCLSSSPPGCAKPLLRRQKDHLRAAPPPHWLVARDRQ